MKCEKVKISGGVAETKNNELTANYLIFILCNTVSKIMLSNENILVFVNTIIEKLIRYILETGDKMVINDYLILL